MLLRGVGGDASTGVILYDFTGGTLPAGATLSRASTGTYFDSGGVMQIAAVDAARFDYGFNGTVWTLSGLLVEPQRTNKQIRSEELDNASIGKWQCSISANAVAAPDGQTTADKIVENTTTGFHGIQGGNRTGPGSGVTIVNTVFAKPAGRNWFFIEFFESPSTFWVWFNVATGVVGTTDASITASIKDMGNGWYRCIAKRTTTTANQVAMRINMAAADGSPTYTGDGTSGIYCWGMQAEETAPGETTYIKTAGSAVTRAADAMNLNLPDGTYTVDLVTAINSYSDAVVVSGGAGYDFDWADFTGAVAAGERHVQTITATPQ